MAKKRGIPANGEFVICKIKSVNPNSAFAELVEYGKEGMIHISEVKRGWVRDIRQHIKNGQIVVAKVVEVSGDHIYLSLKRVYDNQQKDRMREYKFDQKAEKMLEISAKEMKKSLDKAYEEVGFLLEEQFGSLYDAFKVILKYPERVQDLIPKNWFDVIKKVAESSIEQKEFEIGAQVLIKSRDPHGINIIKSVLKNIQDSGFQVKYISAPKYLVKYKTKDPKKGTKIFSEKLEEILKSDKRVDASFKINEK